MRSLMMVEDDGVSEAFVLVELLARPHHLMRLFGPSSKHAIHYLAASSFLQRRHTRFRQITVGR